MLAFGHKRMVEFEGLNKIPRCANYVCSDDTFTAVFLSLDASIISSILILVLDKIMPFTIVIPTRARICTFLLPKQTGQSKKSRTKQLSILTF